MFKRPKNKKKQAWRVVLLFSRTTCCSIYQEKRAGQHDQENNELGPMKTYCVDALKDVINKSIKFERTELINCIPHMAPTNYSKQ